MSYLFFFGAVVFCCGYFYLESRLEEMIVSDNVNSVPYYSTPDNFTVSFKICEDSLLFNFDFDNESVNIAFLENENANYGYNIDYTVQCDYETVGYFVDIVGGIDIENTRYTGVDITELLEYSTVDFLKRKEITEKIMLGISKNGLTQKDMIYLIENSKTNLKFNECFLWTEYIPELCGFIRFIN